MRNIRHLWLILLILLLMLIPFLAFLILLWPHLPTDVTDLWTKPENRAGFILGIASSLAYTIGAGIFVLSRRAILRWTSALVLRKRSIGEEHERVEQEKQYLENLIARFHSRDEDRWEVNKYVDMEATPEDLELQAYRVQPRPWNLADAEASGEGSVRSRVKVGAFLRREKGPILLKGEPGTGKTLTLRRFTVDQAEDALKSLPAEVMMPVYIFLGSYIGKKENNEPEDVYDFLLHYLQDEYPWSGFLHDHLNEYLLQGRVLFLFDGLNELPPDEHLPRLKKLEEFVLRKYPKNKAIFTCRTLRYTSPSFNTVEIRDLSETQMKPFIAKYSGEIDPEMIYRELTIGDGFMLRMCRNPFLLRMLVLVRRRIVLSPRSLAALFKEYIHNQLVSVLVEENGDDELTFIAQKAEKTADVLRDIAFAMQKAGTFAGDVTYEWLQTEFPEVPLEEYLVIAHRAELIDYTPGKKCRFAHQILQEYFAAIALKNAWQQGKELETYIADYRWGDTILVCAGIIEEPEPFICQIWSPGTTYPEAFWLATKAAGSSDRQHISDAYYQSLLEEAKKNLGLSQRRQVIGYSHTVLAVDTIKALSYLDNDQTAELLKEVLLAYSGWLRELCIQTLGGSRNPHSRSLLRSAILSRILPLNDVFLAAPYFSRREWFGILASSIFTFKRPNYILSVLTGKIRWLSSWLETLFWVVLICWLFLLLALLVKNRLFNIDFSVVSGRLLALLVFLLLLPYHFSAISKLLRGKKV